MNRNIPEILVETGREFTGRGMSFRMTASGTSMLPTLRPGDQLLVAPCDPGKKDLLGKVVVVELEGRMYAHRVVKECSRGDAPRYLTKGDCLLKADPVVGGDRVLGVVTHYVRSGKKYSCTTTGAGGRMILRLRSFLYFYYRRLRHTAARMLKKPAA